MRLAEGTCIPFGDGLCLQDVPEWLRKDEHTLADINRMDRQLTLAAKHALVAEYEAASIGEPDPNWKGQHPKSIQEMKLQSAMLANLAMWLRQPAPIRFTVCFNALSIRNGPHGTVPVILDVQGITPLYCHPHDEKNPLTSHHIKQAAELHRILCGIPRKNPVWEALRAMWAGLTMNPADHRYPFFWLGLEALFGDEDYSRGFTKRLCERIALFIAENKKDAQSIYDKASRCYDMRSTIVHGRWENDPALDDVMYETEAIWRTGLRKLMERPDILAKFVGAERNQYLTQLSTDRLGSGWLRPAATARPARR